MNNQLMMGVEHYDDVVGGNEIVFYYILRMGIRSL